MIRPTLIEPAAGDAASRSTGRWLFAGFALLSFVMYFATCMPGVGWQDCAMFQYRIWHTDIAGELGLALAHPLYIFLAKASTFVSWGDNAFRVNLFSALCGALTVGCCALLLWELTGILLATAVGAIALAVSHTFWLHAVIAEVYDLYALGLIVELLLVRRFVDRREAKWLILALLVNGLNVSVHDLALLHAPAYLGLIVWALRNQIIRLPHLLFGAAAFVLGSAPFTFLIITAMAHGQPAIEAIKEALMGRYYSSAVLATDFNVIAQLKKSLLYLVLNFPTPLILLAPCGFYWSWQNPRLRWFALFAGCIFAVDFIFAFRYLVADAYKFFTADYLIWALFIGLAVPHVGRPSAIKTIVFCLLALMPIAAYEIAPTVLRKANISLGVSRELPFRDNYEYFIRPRKNGDSGADQFARVALAQAAPDGLLIADGDSTVKNVLTYVRDVEGVQPGVTLTFGPDYNGLEPIIGASPTSIAPFVNRGQAYVCSIKPGYIMDWIRDNYDLEPVAQPEGIVYRLKPKQ